MSKVDKQAITHTAAESIFDWHEQVKRETKVEKSQTKLTKPGIFYYSGQLSSWTRSQDSQAPERY